MEALGNSNKNCKNRINYEPAFKMLNDELKKINETLVLVCAEGYVMQLNGYRATADVDAFYKRVL